MKNKLFKNSYLYSMTMGIYILCFLITYPAFANNEKIKEPESITAESINNIAVEAKNKNDLHSIILSVWIDNKEILTTALGQSLTDVPATKEMNFRIGAVTISYMSTLLLQLVDQGKVSIDDQLSKWLPNCPHANEITLRMLLNSSTGYPDYVYDETFEKDFLANVFAKLSMQKYINLMTSKPLLFQPGKGWGYSHTNFVLLGQVLEKITGKSMPELLKNNIFSKLNLHHTEFPSTAYIPSPVLHAFTSEREKIYEDSTYWSPSWTSYSGIMISNIKDLITWTRALGSGLLISRHAYQEMLAPTTAPYIKKDLYYGLGIIVSNSWIMQDAKFGGYNVTIAYLPSKKIAIAVAATLGPKSSPDIAYSKILLKNIAAYIAPDHQLNIP